MMFLLSFNFSKQVALFLLITCLKRTLRQHPLVRFSESRLITNVGRKRATRYLRTDLSLSLDRGSDS